MPTISAYVNEEEFDRAKKIADENHTTRSKILKSAFNNVVVEDKTIDLELINEIRAIGNNLNQIAKRCNTRKSIDKLTYINVTKMREEIKRLLP